MMFTLFGDAVVAALLVATISYAAVLNRRLSVLRGDRAKLEELVTGLTIAAQRAEAGVAGLREAADDVGQGLERKIEQAKSLRDDLAYMLERGGGIADRLEETIRAHRDAPEKPHEPGTAVLTMVRAKDKAPSHAPEASAEPEAARRPNVSRAERELIRALAGER